METAPDRIRVLVLLPPIERHVGHWANSSPSIDLVRVIMDGDDLPRKVFGAAAAQQPQAIAIIGKQAPAYLDLLDQLAGELPSLRDLPRVYRCQNTSLTHRLKADRVPADRPRMAELCGWFQRACDPRWSLVLVQTLDDVDLIRQALVPTRVAACPYGYDPAIFDPRAPDLPRTTDVGCYLNLRDNPQRIGLVETASRICRRRGWTFGFVEGKYWHDYAAQIRTTKICLHRSVYREVPYRMYETMALGALFLTDPLQYSVDRLFRRGTDYVTYTPDLSDLEDILHQLLSDRPRWESIRTAGRQQVRQYTWTEIAETYVAPALRDLIRHRA